MTRIRHPPLDEADRLDRGMALAIMGGGCLTIIVIAVIALIVTGPGA